MSGALASLKSSLKAQRGGVSLESKNLRGRLAGWQPGGTRCPCCHWGALQLRGRAPLPWGELFMSLLPQLTRQGLARASV